jgi:hypothetical protein
MITATFASGTVFCRPFRTLVMMGLWPIPGLTPWAKVYRPFRANNRSHESRVPKGRQMLAQGVSPGVNPFQNMIRVPKGRQMLAQGVSPGVDPFQNMIRVPKGRQMLAQGVSPGVTSQKGLVP